MKRFTAKWICVYASIATTVSAVLLIFFELSTKRIKDWSEAVSQMLPHAIFISSGLIALAICASNLGANPKEWKKCYGDEVCCDWLWGKYFFSSG